MRSAFEQRLDRGALESASTADKCGFLEGDSGDRVAFGHFVSSLCFGLLPLPRELVDDDV